MKQIINALVLLTFAAQAQTDTVYIVKHIDDMKGVIYYTPNRTLTITDGGTKQGFKIQPYLNNDRSFKTLYVKMVNIGTCHEKDELILLLENDYRVIATSWKSFNCDGEAYFNLSEKDMQMLRTSPIVKIRITNGIKQDSFTTEVPERNRRYFIQLFKSIDGG